MTVDRLGLAFLAGYMLCIPGANYLAANVGVACVPNGPCVIPVWPEVMAPSGSLLITVALVLRDFVQRRLGSAWALAAILAGTALSAAVAPGPLVLASAIAFLLSELADLAVFTPLQKRGLTLAVVVSSLVGLVIDSILFLYIAFDSLDYLTGQILAKLWMLIVVTAALAMLRRADRLVRT